MNELCLGFVLFGFGFFCACMCFFSITSHSLIQCYTQENVEKNVRVVINL